MALDLGCGVGHWGRVLLPHLPADARLFGIDREPAWVKEAAARAEKAGYGARTSYRLGDAQQIPFHDGVFDLVTCQTVLIHVKDPRAVLREMMRVLKPGGLVAVAEPNNVANALSLGSTRFHQDPDRILGLVRFQMICQRGKEALGEGNNSIGDLLPGYFAEVGLTQIQVHLSDKAAALWPPYAGREQQAVREEEIAWAERGFWIWDREETRRFFLAGGGGEGEFDAQWDAAIAASREIAAGLRAGTEHRAGGGMQYLIAGRKAG
jgi:SAM-dependent methyltransferase